VNQFKLIGRSFFQNASQQQRVVRVVLDEQNANRFFSHGGANFDGNLPMVKQKPLAFSGGPPEFARTMWVANP